MRFTAPIVLHGIFTFFENYGHRAIQRRRQWVFSRWITNSHQFLTDFHRSRQSELNINDSMIKCLASDRESISLTKWLWLYIADVEYLRSEQQKQKVQMPRKLKRGSFGFVTVCLLTCLISTSDHSGPHAQLILRSVILSIGCPISLHNRKYIYILWRASLTLP